MFDFLTKSCCTTDIKKKMSGRPKKNLKFALVGNTNVGKSVFFNHLTGGTQHVANWPGKTIEVAEGSLIFDNYLINVIDLPGIYSLSTFSKEEEVTRDYILGEAPDVVINIIDSASLERNLFFTVQLLELGVPLIIALNQSDIAARKGIEINANELEKLLGVPVVKTVAINGLGVKELIKISCELAENKSFPTPPRLGSRLEAAIAILLPLIQVKTCPKRYAAIKLLEKDEQWPGFDEVRNSSVMDLAETARKELENNKGEIVSALITKERYLKAGQIATFVQKVVPPKQGLVDKLDQLSSHWFFGYIFMFLILGIIFYSIFSFGDSASTFIGDFFDKFRPPPEDKFASLIWEGLIGGFVAGLTLVLPYVLPFYLLITILEDTGYITRIAYLFDFFAHKIGFHGKAIIPLILGYGCNVPACFACRIMEYDRDRLITAFAITLIPCTARTVVVLSLVGAYLGIGWALGLYAFNLLVIMILAKLAFRVLPGEPMGLIMEIHPFKVPSLSSVLKHTWWKIKSILSVVFPYYMIGGLLFSLVYLGGLFTPINAMLAPLTVGWLGLPLFASTLLIFGIVRKEFIVVLPAVIFNTTELSSIFSPLQMIVITIVALFYLPCFATIAALKKEYGWKNALFISFFEVVLAIVLGGLAYRLIPIIFQIS